MPPTSKSGDLPLVATSGIPGANPLAPSSSRGSRGFDVSSEDIHKKLRIQVYNAYKTKTFWIKLAGKIEFLNREY